MPSCCGSHCGSRPERWNPFRGSPRWRCLRRCFPLATTLRQGCDFRHICLVPSHPRPCKPFCEKSLTLPRDIRAFVKNTGENKMSRRALHMLKCPPAGFFLCIQAFSENSQKHLYEFINSFSSFRPSRDSFISRTEGILIDFIHGNPSDIIVHQFLWDTSSNRHLS